MVVAVAQQVQPLLQQALAALRITEVRVAVLRLTTMLPLAAQVYLVARVALAQIMLAQQQVEQSPVVAVVVLRTAFPARVATVKFVLHGGKHEQYKNLRSN